MNFRNNFQNQFSSLSVRDRKRFGFQVAYGSNDLVTIYERKKYSEVEVSYMHPDYDRSLTNDIALVKLKRPLIFTEAVQPACLPDHRQNHYDGVLKVRLSGERNFSRVSKFEN